MEQMILGGSVALWAAVHSWLASSRAKQVIAKLVGQDAARGYRLAYNAFSVLSLAPIALLVRSMPDRIVYRVAMPWSLLLVAGQAISMLLMVVALLQTDVLHFAGLSQIVGRRTSASIVTSGLYRVVRHPLYLLGLMILWLSPSMTMNQLVIYGVLTAYLFAGATLEERRLLHELGSEYATYRMRTPMIIPGLVRPANRQRSPSAD